MKQKTIFFLLTMLGAGLVMGACCDKSRQAVCAKADESEDKIQVDLKDYGGQPAILNIEDYTLANENYMTALWTGDNLQVTLMMIPVGGEIGLEMHDNIDQFLRIEQGTARVEIGSAKDNPEFVQTAKEDCAILVPANKWHNLINIGDKPLKIYSIYAPSDHPFGSVHTTRQKAMEAEEHHE